MKKKSFQIALAAMSCALAAIFMNLGINVSFLIITGYVFGAVSLMLPLAKNFYAGGFLAYLATCLLCLPFGGIGFFYKLFPFIAFFGLHPLINALQQKFKVNKWLSLAIKTVWFDAMLCCTWLLLLAMAGGVELPFAWMNDWIYVIIIVGGTVLFVVYDWVMFRFQKIVNYYVAKLERGRGGSSAPPPEQDSADGIDVFGLDAPQQPEEKNEEENKSGQETGGEDGGENGT